MKIRFRVDGGGEVVIDLRDPRPEIFEKAVRFMELRNRAPGYLLIGWEAYLQLGMVLGMEAREGHAISPTVLSTPAGDVQIVVDDTVADVIRVLPKAGAHRVGGAPRS